VLPVENDQVWNCDLLKNDRRGCIVLAAKHSAKAVTEWQIKVKKAKMERTFEHSVFPIWENEKIVGWLETITDVSDRVRQQSRMIRAERMSVAGELAATLAHEIRNRLTSAKMLLQIEVETNNLTATQREHLIHIDESVKDMERMVEELLAFARPAPIDKKKVNLAELLTTIAEMIKPFAEESGIKLEFHNQVNGTSAHLDLDKIRQALTNLMLNAVQFAGKGQIVSLAVGWLDNPDLINKLTKKMRLKGEGELEGEMKQPDFICFTIDDSGPGIPMNLRAKIFEPFFSTRPSGTGLGLAMVRRAVRDHGGTVIVEDSPMNGARFKIVIPIGEV
jgi:signal transduction histidine kinase